MIALEEILQIFYTISGLNMTIFNLDMHVISSFPHKKSPLCMQLEKNTEAKEKCFLCDKNAMKKYNNQNQCIFTSAGAVCGKLLFHSMHMGK